MSKPRTYRAAKSPKITARYLADYMGASEQVKRTIVRDCKYQPVARVVQHNEAKAAISTFLLDGDSSPSDLKDKAQSIRDRMSDSDFERDLFDHNADYIERFATVYPDLEIPGGIEITAGEVTVATLNGVKVSMELNFRAQRVTRTNKVRVGAGMLRYRKNLLLDPHVADWQSAFLFGYLDLEKAEGVDPEHKLCLTIDAQAGIAHGAPSDSIRRFKNMVAACATIAERWDNILPPDGAELVA